MSQQTVLQATKGWARKLVSIRIAPDTATVSTGQTASFTAAGRFIDGRSKPVTVSWSATGGTIDTAGVFTADSTAGQFLVIGTELATGLTDTAVVIEQNAPADPTPPADSTPPANQPPPSDQPPPVPPAPVVARVLVSPSSSSIQVGDSVQLTASAKDSSGATLNGIAIAWSSSNVAVATVRASGMVLALAGGSATITATAQGVTGRANMTVATPAPTPTPAPAPSPAPAPEPSPVADCSSSHYTRLVPVSTAAQLSAAILDARAGDLIELAPGTYSGRWTLSTSGSASSPIMLCGPRSAILDGGGTIPAPITLAVRASYWTIQGFTIRNAFQPMFLIGVHGVIVKGLEIYNIGQEAIHLHTFSTHNLIDSNYVHDTGKNAPQYGEGIYVGSASSKWCTNYNCQPDRTDSNRVTRNIIGPNIGAQMVDVKEGTTGTIVSGNTFDGVGASVNQDAWLNVYGNHSLVTGNTGTTAQLNGVKVETLVSGWGAYNVFHSNMWNLKGGSGYGFRIGGGTSASTVALGCDNSVLNADSGFATVPCSP